jgi:beta-glucosidase
MVTDNNEILDLGKVMFLRSYLQNAHRAVCEGYPLIGYIHWSLMDNFEWTWGFSRRFGITRVDFNSLTRTPKESFRWDQAAIRENRVI